MTYLENYEKWLKSDALSADEVAELVMLASFLTYEHGLSLKPLPFQLDKAF